MTFPQSPRPAPSPESLLGTLGHALDPRAGSRDKIAAAVRSRVTIPASALQSAHDALEPPLGASFRVLHSILARMNVADVPQDIWRNVREALLPSGDSSFAFPRSMLGRLQPAYISKIAKPLRWVAVCTAFLLLVRLSPMLVLPARTIASSPVLFLPIAGEVRVSIGGLLQPVSGQVTLHNAATLETGAAGSATLIFHDDAVVRLGPSTTLTLDDMADRPAKAGDRTFTLHRGTVWVQGFVPPSFQQVTLGTPHGAVLVHEGSVSVSVDAATSVISTFDRHVGVARGAKSAALVTGERAVVADGGDIRVRRMSQSVDRDPWVVHNLALDAVHRREIAERKRDRRIASAGILPTSPLYVVKRAAETVDVLFALHPDVRALRQLDHAETRLNEAVALVEEGSAAMAAAPLQEYKSAILEVASGSGGSATLQSLVHEQVAEATADIAVVLSSEASFPIKEAVLETTAALPGSLLTPEAVPGVLLVDALTSIRRDVEQGGDLSHAREEFARLQGEYPSIELVTTPLAPEIRREAEEAYAGLLLTLGDDAPVAEQLAPSSLKKGFLSDAARGAVVRRILRYREPRSQYNQFVMEIRSIKRYYPNEEGPVLRALLKGDITPDLRHYVVIEMRRLRQQVTVKAGSGTEVE